MVHATREAKNAKTRGSEDGTFTAWLRSSEVRIQHGKKLWKREELKAFQSRGRDKQLPFTSSVGREEFCVDSFSGRILRPNKQIVWNQVTEHSERVFGDSDWRLENFTFLQERWSPAARTPVACLYCAWLPLCTPTHKETNKHIFFRGGGRRYLLRDIQLSNILMTQTTDFSKVVSLRKKTLIFHTFAHPCKMIAGMKAKLRNGMGGWKYSHLRG